MCVGGEKKCSWVEVAGKSELQAASRVVMRKARSSTRLTSLEPQEQETAQRDQNSLRPRYQEVRRESDLHFNGSLKQRKETEVSDHATSN
jgi:hypothetical protein